MDLNIFLLFGALTTLFLMYFLVDVNYFIRSVFIILTSKLFRKRIKFLGKSEIYGIVLPSDADLLLTHMNNARVFREFDFGRWDHFQRTGLLEILWQNKGWGVVSSQTCRYRRALHMFMMYKIQTRPVFYDSKNIYFEHKVISLQDQIVRCIAHVKLTVNLDLDKVVAKHFPDTVKLPIPKDLELYVDYNRVNSERLRAIKRRSKSRDERTSDGHQREETCDQMLHGERFDNCESEPDNLLQTS